MIYLGLDDSAKAEVLSEYQAAHAKIYVLSPARFAPPFAPEHMSDPDSQCDGRPGLFIDWPDIIQYRYYYKLLQEIDRSTLVVVNECLRTHNRYELTYNCIRLFLAQAGHVLIFQHLPIIDTIADFMVLFDFATNSQWKRERFRPELLGEASVSVAPVPLEIHPQHVPVDDKTRAAYAREKAALLAAVREDPEKDPHILPRNLLLVSGKAKLGAVDPGRRYVGRNNRFKLDNMETFREASGHGERVVFEPPHNFIDMTDFLTISRQHRLPMLVADTKVDEWYLQRYRAWAERVRDAQAILQR